LQLKSTKHQARAPRTQERRAKHLEFCLLHSAFCTLPIP
jgi:hypothetical protein